MASGWKYTVAVPSWSQTQLRDDQAVIFYSIEVKLIPPEDSAHAERRHTVMRRFSHFQKLYLRLREAHGAQTLANMKLPPKLPLSNVASHPHMIDRRRGDLEQWLWRVVANAELARSPLVLSFLELSEAARVVPHAAAATPPQQHALHAAAQQPRRMPAAIMPQPGGPTSNGQEQQQQLPPVHEEEAAHIIAAEGHAQRQMRLGFRIEQRVLLRKHIKLLRQHLDRATAELKACM